MSETSGALPNIRSATNQPPEAYVADAEVITAVPLTARQVHMVEISLISMLKRQISLTLTVDPTLLGGVRIIANNMVIDDSIKRKLFDMKHSITKEVFQSE